MGSTIHCWNISESGSISNSNVGNDASLAKQKADEATLAMGCGHNSKAGHGGTYYMSGCYDSTDSLTWDTQSSVVESNFCYGGCLSNTPPPPSTSSTNPPPPSLFSGADYGAPGVTFAALIAILVFLLC